MFSPTPTWLSEVDPELSQGKFFSLGTLNKKGGVLLSTMNPPPPPPDPPLAKYKPHPFLEETLVGTSKVHTQVLRLLIPILIQLGVQQSKLLLSWIQVTSYYHNVIPGKLDFPGQNY